MPYKKQPRRYEEETREEEERKFSGKHDGEEGLEGQRVGSCFQEGGESRDYGAHSTDAADG